MNYRMHLYILTTVLLLPCAVGAESNTKQAVSNCGPEAVQCNATVNAVGDFVNIDVTRYPVIDWGTISTEKGVSVELPRNGGTQTVYSLTPTQGESKDMKIFVVFDNIAQRRGSELFGRTFIKIYRRFASEKATDWVEVGNIRLEGKEVPSAPVKVMLKPDGTAVWLDPETNKPMVFLVSKKDFVRSR